MDLNLTRVDLCQLGTMSRRNTLVLLPKGKNPKQKFVVGEDSGAVTCFKIKRGDAEQVFQAEAASAEVDAVTLGGTAGKKDRIFICRGNVVEGYSKAGKRFFKFNTQLTDALLAMAVEARQIYCIQNYVYSMFEDAKDCDFLVSPDAMNALTVEHVVTQDSDEKYDAVVGCQDAHVRVISGSEAVIDTVALGPVECISRYGVDAVSGKRVATAKTLIYGTSNGIVAQLEVHSEGGEPSLRPGWKVQTALRQAQVNCITSFDMTMDDVHDVIVGRDDGVVQIYGFDMGAEPSKQFEIATSESCRSLQAGVVSSQGFQELLLCSFSGRVISLTSERLYTSLEQGDKKGRTKGKAASDDKAEALQSQLTALRSKIDVAREEASKVGAAVQQEQQKQQQSSQAAAPSAGAGSSSGSGGGGGGGGGVSGSGVLGVYGWRTLPAEGKPFKTSSSFIFNPEDGTYKITLEVPCALSMVLLQSSVPVDVLDVEGSEAIMTKCPVPLRAGAGSSAGGGGGGGGGDAQKRPHALLASYRCAEPMKRIEMGIRPVEGQFGTLQAFVIADLEPCTAQIVKFEVTPLSLHAKVDAVEGFAERPLNSLTFSGSFSIRQMHEWMMMLFPNYTSHLPKDASSNCILFENVFLGSGLQCEYRRSR
jgi:Bardet-Biedl syndrome 7 protein